MNVALITVAVMMIIATALPLLPSDSWWIRIWDFPRLQIAVILALTAIAWLSLSAITDLFSYLLLSALLVCLVYQIYMMYPYTVLARKQVQQSTKSAKESRVSLLFANVLMDNRDARRLLEIVRKADPDIILTVETDSWWQAQLKEFEKTHPFTVQQPQDNTYGMLLYSRLKLLDAQVKFLVQDDVPSIHGRVRLASGQEVAIHCLHPRPPFPTEEERSTERDAELVIVGRAVKREDDPEIVFGDLNDVAWSRTTTLFQHISGLLDPRIGRGFYNTFHARYPIIRFPLDHFFSSRHFRLVDFRRLDYFGSDHFPVFIALSYEPDAVREQEELHSSESEQEEASEKIEEAA